METRTAETILKVYAILVWLNTLLLFVISIALVFGGTLVSAAMDDQVASMLQLPSVLIGRVLGAVGVAAGIIVLLFSILYLFVGMGLWKRQHWARIAILVIGVFMLLSFPLGTLVGGFGIWFFGFSEGGKKLFRIQAPPAPRARSKKR